MKPFGFSVLRTSRIDSRKKRLNSRNFGFDWPTGNSGNHPNLAWIGGLQYFYFHHVNSIHSRKYPWKYQNLKSRLCYDRIWCRQNWSFKLKSKLYSETMYSKGKSTLPCRKQLLWQYCMKWWKWYWTLDISGCWITIVFPSLSPIKYSHRQAFFVLYKYFDTLYKYIF